MSSQLSQPFSLPGIAMAGRMPEVFGDGGSYQGAGPPFLQQFDGAGQPAKPRIGSAGGGLSWLNAGLQRLVVDPEGCRVGKGVARLPLQSRVGADQRSSTTHQ